MTYDCTHPSRRSPNSIAAFNFRPIISVVHVLKWLEELQIYQQKSTVCLPVSLTSLAPFTFAKAMAVPTFSRLTAPHTVADMQCKQHECKLINIAEQRRPIGCLLSYRVTIVYHTLQALQKAKVERKKTSSTERLTGGAYW